MRSTTINKILLAVVVCANFGYAVHAKADALVLGLDETSGVENVAANTAVGQDAVVSTTTTIDGFAFYLEDPSGAPLTYTITDLTDSTVLFSETFDDTTLDPALTSVAIPESTKQWLELYIPPLTLVAGADVLEFSVSSTGALKVGIDPTTMTEIGLGLPAGDDATELGLRVWDPPAAVTPEPSPLLLLATGTMMGAGLLRRQLVRQPA